MRSLRKRIRLTIAGLVLVAVALTGQSHGRLPIVELTDKLGPGWRGPLLAVNVRNTPASNMAVAPLSALGLQLGLSILNHMLMRLGLVGPPLELSTPDYSLAIVNLRGSVLRVIDEDGEPFRSCRLSADGSRMVWQKESRWFTCALPHGAPGRLELPVRVEFGEQGWFRTDPEAFRISADGSAAVLVSGLTPRGSSFGEDGPFGFFWVDLQTGKVEPLDTLWPPPVRALMWRSFSEGTKYYHNWPDLICDISPDGGKVVCAGTETASEGSEIFRYSGIFRYDVAKGTRVRLPGEGDCWDYWPRFAPLGDGVCFLRMPYEAGYRYIAERAIEGRLICHDLATGLDLIASTFEAWFPTGTSRDLLVPSYWFVSDGLSDGRHGTTVALITDPGWQDSIYSDHRVDCMLGILFSDPQSFWRVANSTRDWRDFFTPFDGQLLVESGREWGLRSLSGEGPVTAIRLPANATELLATTGS